MSPTKPSVPAVVDEPRFPALANDPALMLEAFKENLGGEQITDRDLDLIKMPSGGGRSWEIPTLEGIKPVAEIEGVIISHHLRRAYWPSRQLTGRPPQCTSPDSNDGFGDPGDGLGNSGACLVCPLAQFGSAPANEDGTESNGQACKQMRQVFVLMDDGLLPRVVTLPPTSLASSKKFFIGLASAGKVFHRVTVKIGLDQKQGPAGPYSVATWKLGDELAPAEAEAVAAYRDAILPMIATRRVTAADAAAAGMDS